MDNLLRKLNQLKKRKHRRDEMMEHIKSFLREEQENEDNEQVQTVVSSPQSSPAPYSSSSPPSGTVLDVEKQAAVSTLVRHEERSYRADMVPEAEVESHKCGFAPVQPSHPQTTGLQYSPISSGMASLSHIPHNHNYMSPFPFILPEFSPVRNEL